MSNEFKNKLYWMVGVAMAVYTTILFRLSLPMPAFWYRLWVNARNGNEIFQIHVFAGYVGLLTAFGFVVLAGMKTRDIKANSEALEELKSDRKYEALLRKIEAGTKLEAETKDLELDISEGYDWEVEEYQARRRSLEESIKTMLFRALVSAFVGFLGVYILLIPIWYVVTLFFMFLLGNIWLGLTFPVGLVVKGIRSARPAKKRKAKKTLLQVEAEMSEESAAIQGEFPLYVPELVEVPVDRAFAEVQQESIKTPAPSAIVWNHPVEGQQAYTNGIVLKEELAETQINSRPSKWSRLWVKAKVLWLKYVGVIIVLEAIVLSIGFSILLWIILR